MDYFENYGLNIDFQDKEEKGILVRVESGSIYSRNISFLTTV